MSGPLKNGSMTIQRAVLLDGLRALYYAQNKFDRLLKEDSYACGYREGFEDALLSMAQMIGVNSEFEKIRLDQDANGALTYHGRATVIPDRAQR